MTDTEILDHLLELDSTGQVKCLIGNPHLFLVLVKALKESRNLNKISKQIASYQYAGNEDLIEAFQHLLDIVLTSSRSECSSGMPARGNAESFLSSLITWHKESTNS